MNQLFLGVLLTNTFSAGYSSDCCAEKRVGDYVYYFVEMGAGWEYDCLDNCTYSRKGDPDTRYCFQSGYQTAQCLKGEECCDVAVPMNFNWIDGQCIMDTETRFFDYYIKLDQNRPMLCVKECSEMVKSTPFPSDNGFVFAGLQDGNQCFCGSSYPPRSIFAPRSQCNIPCPGESPEGNFTCGGAWTMNVYTTGLRTGYAEWHPILDGFNTAGGIHLALTPDTDEIGSSLSTKPLGPYSPSIWYQMWKMDRDGRIVNRLTGLVIDGDGGPSMQKATPLTPSKQWKSRSDIRSDQETNPVTVPKLVVDGTEYCINTADRFAKNGSSVLMFDCTKVYPDNAWWIPNFFEFRPILDCGNTSLAITTLGTAVGSKLSTKPVTGEDNQMWAFDSKKRLVNKETGLVMDGSSLSAPSMQQPIVPSVQQPITPESQQWRLEVDIRSSQETGVETVPKVCDHSKKMCLNTQDRFDPEGSPIILFPGTAVNPGNACWIF